MHKELYQIETFIVWQIFWWWWKDIIDLFPSSITTQSLPFTIHQQLLNIKSVSCDAVSWYLIKTKLCWISLLKHELQHVKTQVLSFKFQTCFKRLEKQLMTRTWIKSPRYTAVRRCWRELSRSVQNKLFNSHFYLVEFVFSWQSTAGRLQVWMWWNTKTNVK